MEPKSLLPYLPWVLLALGAVCLIVWLVRALRRLRSRASALPFRLLAQLLREDGSLAEDPGPRSLNGCDSILLPKIRKDFPDFDENAVKEAARAHLAQALAGAEDLRIHNVVLSKYLSTPARKTIFLQAALELRQGGRLLQKRYELQYLYAVQSSGSGGIALTCPSCGAPIAFGQTTCQYCGCRVIGAAGNWSFGPLREA